MQNLKKLLIPLTLFIVKLVACSPSSKNEQQYWENHKKNAEEFKTKYAGFATVIDTQMKAATPMMDEAAKLTDEKAKAEKMKEGNAVAAKVVGRLNEVKGKYEQLSKKVKALGQLKLDPTKGRKRKDAMNAANKVLTEVDTAMAAATPTNLEEAEKVMGEQISALISAQGAANRAYTAVAPKKKSRKKKKSSKKKK